MKLNDFKFGKGQSRSFVNGEMQKAMGILIFKFRKRRMYEKILLWMYANRILWMHKNIN